jgi:hypothetical protein
LKVAPGDLFGATPTNKTPLPEFSATALRVALSFDRIKDQRIKTIVAKLIYGLGEERNLVD